MVFELFLAGIVYGTLCVIITIYYCVSYIRENSYD
jgi:TRAP-type C4-dicarboxylate transport system permease large subunit